MNTRPLEIERHCALPRDTQPAYRMPFGGCDCSAGLVRCNCTDACRLPEPSVESAHPWFWLLYVVALVGTVASCAVINW